MLFNSYLFWVFFAIVLSLYRLVAFRWTPRVLAVTGYCLLGWWDWRLLGLSLVFMTLASVCARGMASAIARPGPERSPLKTVLLLASVAVHLGYEAALMAFGFFRAPFLARLSSLDISLPPTLVKVLLPACFVYYILRSISYTLDVYRAGASAPGSVWDLYSIVHRLAPHQRQNWLLLIAGYVFYGWWDWRFMALMATSTTMDYAIGRGIWELEKPLARKVLLAASVFMNLAFLGFFKYYNFFSAEMARLLHFMGFQSSLPTLNVILPVGISFYTFVSMSYIIDVYRRQAPVARSLWDYAVFVNFFPHLVAGPIMRYTTLMPQVENRRPIRPEDFAVGLYHVLLGLFKKVVIADNMAPIANAVFHTRADHLTGVETLVGTYAFAFQIYCDFSAYSSITQGLARWMGFELMDNFRMPYFAVSPSDFWRRWHISLSTWLRDYLYIPLGGNRHGRWNNYRNLLLTMFLGGLWHGANWTFVAWGAFHGLLLTVYRRLGELCGVKKSPTLQPWQKAVSVLIMFHLICFSWLLFRADSVGQAYAMFLRIFTDFRITPMATFAFWTIVFYVSPLILYELWVERKDDLLCLVRVGWLPRALVYSYMALMLWYFNPETSHEFIYFQF